MSVQTLTKLTAGENFMAVELKYPKGGHKPGLDILELFVIAFVFITIVAFLNIIQQWLNLNLYQKEPEVSKSQLNDALKGSIIFFFVCLFFAAIFLAMYYFRY